MSITTADGTLYTGVAVIRRNNLVVLFAIGEGGNVAPRPTAPTSVPAAPPRYGRPMSLWEHEHRQRLQEDDEDDGWRS
jgi:hypothetical protein